MTNLRIIDDAAIRSLLPPDVAAAVVSDALVRLSAGDGVQPQRTSMPVHDGGHLLTMPAGDTDGAFAVKLVSLFPANAARGLPIINGLVVLFDPDTGRPCAVLDGAAITEIRTAAVSAVATGHLARPDAHRLTVVGAGPQARAHLSALATVRPWTDIRVTGRTASSAHALSVWAHARGIPVSVVDDVDDAVRDADVICTTTSSVIPVFDAASVAATGVHLNAVGAHRDTARELPGPLVGRADIFVESVDAATAEAGDLLLARAEGLLHDDTPWTELGDVIAGRRPGRVTAEQTTLFKSVGVAFEDLATAAEAHRLAVANGLGAVVRLS